METSVRILFTIVILIMLLLWGLGTNHRADGED